MPLGPGQAIGNDPHSPHPLLTRSALLKTRTAAASRSADCLRRSPTGCPQLAELMRDSGIPKMVVVMEPERRPVEIVVPTFGHNVDDRRGGPPEFPGELVSDQAELCCDARIIDR